jgi:hypothetical protein
VNKQDYAYGYKLVFENTQDTNSSKKIYINRLNRIDLEEFPYQVDFTSSQGRKIHLNAKYNFKNSKNLLEFLFVVEDVAVFHCDAVSQQIRCLEDYLCTDNLITYWLIHIVLPMYFTLSDTYYLLHTGSVVVDETAVLFLGDSHAGKSTLTNYFLSKNHALLSDDKLATYCDDESFLCVGSHPYHRPYRETETLGIKANKFHDTTLELGNIYWINPVEAEDDVVIEEIRGIKKFEILKYSTEMDLPVNQEKRFAYITKLANAKKVYEIKIPRDLERLEEVYTKIITHTQES